MPKKATKNKRGFTLTEVLIVVLIISVLAAIVYPMYTKVITKSRAVEAINLLEMVRNRQLQKFAKDRSYYTTVDGLGQITSSGEQSVDGPVLKVKDYTISLNAEKSCMTASYVKNDKTIFSFSSSYERSGLGCTGDICSSFGNVIGGAQEVCNCGSKVCPGGQTLNENTCECSCLLSCNQDGKCFEPYGGGESRPCASGCGTETSTASCNGPVWTGSCAAAYLKHPISEACGTGGTRTRSCTPDCGGGTCGEWSACTGGKTVCPSSCPAGQKRDASVSYIQDGACCISKAACPSSCPSGQKRDTSVTSSEDGACCVAKTACPSSCPSGQKRDTSVNYTEDGSCCVAVTKTPCPSTCQAGYKRDTSVSYSEDGSCCVAVEKTPCPSTCQAGYQRDTNVKYSEDGECCVRKSCDSAEASLCSSTAGSWNNSDCSCSCNSPQVWNSTTGCACPAATPYFYSGSCNKCKQEEVQSKGVCCPKGYVSRDGVKCVVDLKPKRQTINVLANCHEDNDVGWNGNPPASCRVTKKGYFIGGSLPYVASTVTNHSYGVWPFKKKCKDGAEAHTSYYYGGTWWNGGTQVYPQGNCYGGTDQQICDSQCTTKPCTFMCTISENVPSKCPSYYHYYSYYGRCEGYLDRTSCDNTKGSAVVLTCE